MDVAVVIPFRGDAAVLRWTLEGFARQKLPGDVKLHVRVCGDGAELPPMPQVMGPGIRFTGMLAQHVGAAEAKNLLLQGQPADVVIFANSDTRPGAGFVAAHVMRLMSLPQRHLVLGASPYERAPDGGTVFDALKEHTPMVFFYQQMKPHELYDFRHCWTLNLSVRYADLDRAGFFQTRFRPYGYEDVELGFRLLGGEKKAIYFEPEAEVVHRHPMTFDNYLNREELLGLMTPALHDLNPALFEKLFGREGLEALARRYREWAQMDRAGQGWIYRRMEEWNGLPAAVLGQGAGRERLMMTLYQMHVPLKRLAFRLGFLRGMELRADAQWPERVVKEDWRAVVGERH